MADNKPSLMSKKRLELTAEEIQQLKKPIGVAGLPYPKISIVEDANGETVYQLDIVQDTNNPIVVYSDMTPKQVTGIMYREMASKVMLMASQELLARLNPERADRVVAMIGDPGWGKTHEFRKIGKMAHPDGAIIVDMGGMNANEVLWRTVIDYGKGTREIFDKRLAAGQVSDETLKTLEEAFPGSVVRVEGGASQVTTINWDAVGRRRPKSTDAAGNEIPAEDRGAAVKRAKELLEFLYEQEKITVQSNAFGIKTVPGEIFEAHWSGRPLLLDELTKALPETINTLQSVLQVFNGEIAEFEVKNPSAESSEFGDNDSPKSIVLRASDVRASFLLGVAGNDKSDGATTFDFSESFSSRILKVNIGDPDKDDWAHRTSQLWTGLPLSTLNLLYAGPMKTNPEAYAKFLIDLRKLDLNADQVNAIPPHHTEFLKKYSDTAAAIDQFATTLHTWDQLSREDSALLAKDEYKQLVDELGEKAKRIKITPRIITQIYNQSIHTQPEARPVAEAKLNFDLEATFNSLDTSVIGQTAPAWHRFGKNVSDAMRWTIVNFTVGMKKTRAALIGLAKANGITPPDFKEAQVSDTVKTLAELLKYDQHPDAGGSEHLLSIRSVLLTAIRSQSKNKNLRQPDDVVLPMPALARAVAEMESRKDETPFTFVVPNNDLDTVQAKPLLAAQALPIYELTHPETSDEFNLVDFRDVLASLVVPQFGEKNRQHMWPVELLELLDKPPKHKLHEDGTVVLDDKGEPVPDLEPYHILEGHGEWGINFVILRSANKQGDPVNLWVIEDKTTLQKAADPAKAEHHRFMIVGPEAIPPELEVALAKNNVTYIVKSDPGMKKTVNEFLIEGARIRGVDGQIDPEAAEEVTEAIVKSYAVTHSLPPAPPGTEHLAGKGPVIGPEATLGEFIEQSKDSDRPAVFVSIVTPKPAPGPGK